MITEEQIRANMYVIVSSVCDELSDMELNVLSLVAELEGRVAIY